MPLVAAIAAATFGFFTLIVGLLFRSRGRAVVTGAEALLGAEGEALAWDGEEGRVRVRGEIWRARSSGALNPGTRVKVIDRDGLVLVVAPA